MDTAARTEVLEAIDEVAKRLADMVAAAPDLDVRVPATPDWTVAEAFAHVVTAALRYERGPRHDGEWAATPDGVVAINAKELGAAVDRDVQTQAMNLHASVQRLTEQINGYGDAQPFYRFHGGEKIPADTALGVLLGELVVHGHDIARALHHRWPIEPRHVELIQQGLNPILPGWLDRDRTRNHTATYEMRLRGQGVHQFAFCDGTLAINPEVSRRPDVVISADPATYLLVMYKRQSQWPGVFTGKLVATGRRPWLAFAFSNLFHRP